MSVTAAVVVVFVLAKISLAPANKDYQSGLHFLFNKAKSLTFYPLMKVYFRVKSKSQNRNLIFQTSKSASGIIHVTTKAWQLCSTPFVLVTTC